MKEFNDIVVLAIFVVVCAFLLTLFSYNIYSNRKAKILELEKCIAGKQECHIMPFYI
jgi:hypothetical protein